MGSMRRIFSSGGLWFLLFLVLILQADPVYGDAFDLRINEVMVANGSAYLDSDEVNYSDWIEIYNGGSSSVNLGGMYLSDDPSDPEKWRIPTSVGSIPAGGFALFWADGIDDDNHTNFKLNRDGETVLLSNSSGNLIDSLDYEGIEQLPDVSYGRQTDGSNTWVYFGHDQITPDASNNGADGVTDVNQVAPTPNFSVARGFYSGSISVSLSAASLPAADIYYTTDGSIPMPSDTRYTGSINISDTTVLRARSYAAGYLPSAAETHTYFIGEPTSDLPVFSLSTDPDNLYDDDIGIYTDGDHVNYDQPWERPMSLEFYEDDRSFAFEFAGGMEIHGNSSRKYERKSLSISTGAQYGSDTLNYQLIKDRERFEFDSFLLRTSGGDRNITIFRDALASSLVENYLDIDIQGYQPAILYINGEYWGIHNIREKSNAGTLDYYHDENDIDLLKNNRKISQGDAENYEDFLDYIEDHDMSDPAHYQVIKDWMEVGEYMDYHIASQYYAHTSWPANNMKFWRPRKPSGEWRWFLHDIDSGFDLREDGRCYVDQIAYTSTSSSNPYEWSQIIMRELLENDEFRHEFGQRYAANLSLTFHPDRVISFIDDMEDGIETEIPRHIDRWGFLDDIDDWRDNVDVMRDFARCRPDEIIKHIRNNLDDFNSTSDLTINIVNPEGGEVYVHDVLMLDDSLTGEFFDNIPIRLHAKPKPGYRFAGWQEIGDPTKKTELTINGDFTITAVFELYTPPKLVINEIHYNPSPAQGIDEDYEFIEIYNADTGAIDLTGYRITKGIEYTFTTGIINPGEYIVLTSNALNYSGNGYQVFEWDAVTGGKLRNSGELLRLKDSFDIEVDVVEFDDDSPWVTSPDGNGPSLELIAPDLENAGDDVDPSAYFNWTASDIAGGTPGHANDDTPRVTVVETSGGTAVAEGGVTDAYQIFLNTLPTADVDIRITPDGQLDLGSGAGQAITLTFTASNGRTPQTVNVTAVDDLVDEGDHASTLTHQATSADGDYDGIDIDDVDVDIEDNDTPGITLAETSGTTAVAEGGATDTYSLVLDSVPASDVEITLDPDNELDLGAGDGQAVTLTFTPANAQTPQIVTVTAVDDAQAEGAHTGNISHQVSSSDGRYNNFTLSSLEVTITDNDVPGVTLSKFSLSIGEDGQIDQYTIQLNSAPAADVDVMLTPDNQVNLGQGVGNPVVLTFTPANAQTPQSVTAVTSDDDIVEGTQTQSIQHQVVSGDGSYHNLAVGDVDVSISDNDAAGVTLIESDGQTLVSEGGLTDSYQIVLDRRPNANVIITVDPRNQLDVGNGAGNSIELTFTPNNALTPQTVSVAAVDDNFAEDLHDSKINHSISSANEPYDNLSVDSIEADIIDNDTAGFSLVETGGTTEVTEGSQTDTYAITLNTVPVDDVEIIITPGEDVDVGSGAGVPHVLLIRPDEALESHTVTVSAVDDGQIAGPRTVMINHVAASNDPVYNAIAPRELSISILDAGTTAVTLQQLNTSAPSAILNVTIVGLTLVLGLATAVLNRRRSR